MSIHEESSPPNGKIHSEFHRRFKIISHAISLIIEKGIKKKEFKYYPPYVVGSIILYVTSIFAHREFNENSSEGVVDPDLIVKILMNGLAR